MVKKIIILILLSFVGFCLTAQNNRMAFSIGISQDPKIEQKVEKYLEKKTKRYELIYKCNIQKIYIIDLKYEEDTPLKFLVKISQKFHNSTQFLFKNVREMTDFSCRLEYLQILSKEIE